MASQDSKEYTNPAEKKLEFLQRFGAGKKFSLLLA
jgi:hypothetical protein